MAAGEEISRSGGEYFSPLNKHVELRQKNGREETKKTKILTKIILLSVDLPFFFIYAL